MKALENIKILDLSQRLTASLATMYLSAYGAEVTKVERPDGGDAAREWEPKRPEGSLYFNYLNSGKKSITIDVTKPEGQEIIRKLIPQYDVICTDESMAINNYGLEYEQVKAIKPKIIYAGYSYWGANGPYKDKPGSSITVQAKGVAMDMTGVIGERPVHAGPSIAEHYSAAYLASGIVLALIDKEKRGIGQMVDIAMLDSIYSCIEAAPAAYSTVGELQERKGNFDPSCAPYDTFETCDGYVAIGVATQNQWEKFCDTMGFANLKEDPRFADNEGRRTDYLNVLRPLLAEQIIGYSKMEVENKCRVLGIPCCSVLTIPEITDLPNTLENNYMTKFMSSKYGELKYPTIPFTLSETAADDFADAPELGADNETVLQ